MIGCWSQILTDGDNLHANTCEIYQGFFYFLLRLTHAHNHSRLCSEIGCSSARQYRKTARITRRRSHCSLQSGNCLDVVIKHVGSFGDQDVERVSSFDIGDQCLDFCAKVQRTNCSHGAGYMLHATISQIVTSHHGQYSKLKSHSLHGFGHAAWFIGIWQQRLLRINQTKTTCSSAPIAEHHKCCSAIIPTLTQVWAACLLAYGHQIQITKRALCFQYFICVFHVRTNPLWLTHRDT